MNLKKSALSVAVAGALGVVALPATAGDVGTYGRLDVGLQIHTTPDLEDSTDTTETLNVQGVNSRFGFKGTEDLGNGWEALYRYEFRVFGDTATIQDGNRLSYVGLKGDAGTFTLGRQWSAMFNHIGTYLDPTLFLGTSATAYRNSDTIKYAGSAGAASWEVDLIADDGGNEDDIDRYTFGVTVGVGNGINISGGLDSISGGDAGEDTDQFGVAGSFALGKMATIRAGFHTTDTGDDEDTQFVGVNATINGGGGLSFLVGVQSLTDDDDEGAEYDRVYGGVYKKLSSRTRVYGEFASDSFSGDQDDATNIYLGVRHDY